MKRFCWGKSLDTLDVSGGRWKTQRGERESQKEGLRLELVFAGGAHSFYSPGDSGMSSEGTQRSKGCTN